MEQLAYSRLKVRRYRSIILLAIPLVLSAYTHLWNPVGFPAVWVVEGQYMHRVMHVLEGIGLHEPRSIYPHSYDHPFFGQIIMASIFAIVGYPDSLGPTFSSSSSTVTTHSIETLWLVPRVLMGLLAVLDTFLVYKIAERRYNKTIALIASILFAVMPLSWILRKIFLESILMPLLLSSILFAVSRVKKENNFQNKYLVNTTIKKKNVTDNLPLILISGIFLGISIFTKVPAFTMIPLVGYFIFTNNNNSWKSLVLWFIPVILIPLFWPAYAIIVGDFNLWVEDTTWNMQRPDFVSNSPLSGSLLNTLKYIFQIDPILFILGIAGIIYSELKRDRFILLWTIPFLVFLFL